MTKIEYEDDPKVPGRRTYRITGSTKDEVLNIINARLCWVDTAMGGVPGRAYFIGPAKLADNWYGAIGEVIIND